MELDTLRNRYINKYVGAIPTRASRLLKQMLVSIWYDFGNLSLVRRAPNLSRDERSALKKLVQNKDLMICKADKGNVTVIMATLQYVDLAYKHLWDKTTYQLLETNPTINIV